MRRYHSIKMLEVHKSVGAPAGNNSSEANAQAVCSVAARLFVAASRIIAGEFGTDGAASDALFRTMTSLLHVSLASGSVVPFVRLCSLLTSTASFGWLDPSTPAAGEFMFLLYRCGVELARWAEEATVGGFEEGGGHFPQGNGGVFDPDVSIGATLGPDGKSMVGREANGCAVINYPMSEVRARLCVCVCVRMCTRGYFSCFMPLLCLLGAL